MSALAEQHETWADARKRLWGRPQTVRLVIPARELPPEPEPIRVEATRPETKDEILALMDESDNSLWRDGVKRILRSYSETMRRLVSHQRDRNIIECRVAVAGYLRQRGWSYPRIGQVMNRDHSSIIHLLNPAKRREAYQHRATGGL